jgi:hypothetical protein
MSNAAVDVLVREILREALPGEAEELAKRVRQTKRRAKPSQTSYTINGNIGEISVSPAGGRLHVHWDDHDPETEIDVEVSLDELERVLTAWLAR